MMRFQFNAMALALLLPTVQGMSFCVAGELDKVSVFSAGRDGYHFYRILAIVTTPDGTLLTFCEGRKASRSDDGDILTCCCAAAATEVKHGCWKGRSSFCSFIWRNEYPTCKVDRTITSKDVIDSLAKLTGDYPCGTRGSSLPAAG